MKKVSIIFLAAMSITVTSFSQVAAEKEKVLREQNIDTIYGWVYSIPVIITASQSSFNNWAAGGQNSVSFSAVSNMYAGYKTKNSTWDNSLDIGYGVMRQGHEAKWIKTDDRIELTSKFGKRISDKLFYAVLVNSKTQFSPGYKYPNDSVKISDFLAPIYGLAAIGIDYKPGKGLSAFFAPVSMRTTYVNNQTLADQGAFGVDKATYDETGILLKHGKMLRNEFGGYVKLVIRKDDIVKNVNLLTKVDLFSNYLKNPQNLVVNWDLMITMKVNKLLTATVSTNLIYDNDVLIPTGKNSAGVEQYIGPRTQFKEVIGVGISYILKKK